MNFNGPHQASASSGLIYQTRAGLHLLKLCVVAALRSFLANFLFPWSAIGPLSVPGSCSGLDWNWLAPGLLLNLFAKLSLGVLLGFPVVASLEAKLAFFCLARLAACLLSAPPDFQPDAASDCLDQPDEGLLEGAALLTLELTTAAEEK